MSPFPGTKVIPPGWSAHHRPVTEAAMTAVCDITAAGAGDSTIDDQGVTTPPARTTVYSDVPCRVQRLAEVATVQTTGDQQITEHRFLVTLPWEGHGGVQVGHQVNVTTCAEDPSLLDHPLTVIDVERGSLLWERDVTCIDNQG